MTMPIQRRGIAAARYSKSMFVGEGHPDAALAFAESQDWRDTPAVGWAIKAAVASMGTSNSPALLAEVGVDFSAFVRPLTVIGRITGFRKVPMRTRLLTGTGGTTAGWVGEAQPKPISKAAFANLQLNPLKVVGIVVVTAELLRFSTPKADETLQNDMSAAAAEAIDRAFLDPTNVGIADVMPASVTSGVTPIASTGSSVAQIDADLKAMLDQLIAAGSDLVNAVWIMAPSTATSLTMKRGSSGAPAYPAVSARGGELLGIPIATSAHVGGDTSGASIVLLDASAVALGDDDQTAITVTTQASLQLADDPAISGNSVLVSLWQLNCAAIRCERFVNWHLRRPDFVSVLSGVSY